MPVVPVLFLPVSYGAVTRRTARPRAAAPPAPYALPVPLAVPGGPQLQVNLKVQVRSTLYHGVRHLTLLVCVSRLPRPVDTKLERKLNNLKRKLVKRSQRYATSRWQLGVDIAPQYI